MIIALVLCQQNGGPVPLGKGGPKLPRHWHRPNKASSKVETSDSGGCINTQRMSGLLLKTMIRPPTATSTDTIRNPIDNPR